MSNRKEDNMVRFLDELFDWGRFTFDDIMTFKMIFDRTDSTEILIGRPTADMEDRVRGVYFDKEMNNFITIIERERAN